MPRILGFPLVTGRTPGSSLPRTLHAEREGAPAGSVHPLLRASAGPWRGASGECRHTRARQAAIALPPGPQPSVREACQATGPCAGLPRGSVADFGLDSGA